MDDNSKSINYYDRTLMIISSPHQGPPLPSVLSHSSHSKNEMLNNSLQMLILLAFLRMHTFGFAPLFLRKCWLVSQSCPIEKTNSATWHMFIMFANANRTKRKLQHILISIMIFMKTM